MSIVGPRPQPAFYLPYYKEEERVAHKVRGGLLPPDCLGLESQCSWEEQFRYETLRRSCYDCKYCTVNKPADITMGDFWGIDNVDPEFDDGLGCSLLITHSVKGERIVKLLDKYAKSEDLTQSDKKAS